MPFITDNQYADYCAYKAREEKESERARNWEPSKESEFANALVSLVKEKYEKRIAELERWIPVSERLPEEAGWYWCEVYSQLSKSYFRMAVFFNPHHHRGEKFEISTMNYAVSRYWDMPLPAPPEDK